MERRDQEAAWLRGSGWAFDLSARTPVCRSASAHGAHAAFIASGKRPMQLPWVRFSTRGPGMTSAREDAAARTRGRGFSCWRLWSPATRAVTGPLREHRLQAMPQMPSPIMLAWSIGASAPWHWPRLGHRPWSLAAAPMARVAASAAQVPSR